MFPVANRAEFTAGFRPQLLTTQTGSDGFNIVLRQLISKTRRTIALLCLSECVTDGLITNESELLRWGYLTTATTPDIPAAACNPKHPTHRFNTERCPMFFDEDNLHFRRFVKYVATYLENSQFFIAFRQLALQVRIFGSQSDEVICCCCLLHHPITRCNNVSVNSGMSKQVRLQVRETDTHAGQQPHVLIDWYSPGTAHHGLG